MFQVYDWVEPNWELLKQMEEAKAAEIEAAKAAQAEAKQLKLEQTQKAASVSQYSSTPAESNPLSLVTMIEFSGPEAEGFHNCFWVGPAIFLDR